MNPINVTGYDRAERAEQAELDEPLTASEIIASSERHRAESQRRLDAALWPLIEPIFNRLLNLITQRPGGHRKMKIHQVVNESTGEVIGFIRAHTRAGAERYAANKIKPTITATVATQEDLVKYLTRGGKIEDATNSPQASIPEPAQTQE